MPTILKLGGSILSNKNMPFSVKWDNLERIAMEIRNALDYYKNKNKEIKLILVHGGGSFGHPVAKKYLKIENGNKTFVNMEKGFWDIQKAMRRFNNIVIDTLQSYGIPAVSIQPSSFVVFGDKLIFDTSAIKEMLKRNLVPVVHGDIVVDDKNNFKIISGDDIVPYLANNLKADLILYATDVDGVLINNNVIKRIDEKNIDEVLSYLSGSNTIDVTGGMRYKIEMIRRNKCRGFVFNGNKVNNIYKALLGEVEGTEIDFSK
ncbi:isopentenyl phosphate kinase [Methanocaldococcus fervens]|uniref:Isopentenyl phosphate kinase n=1 Tax=Methanocaldococcus fervens (strain DSM 4213 / JCM 15782 / AG86) TaxID=573064 RepID=C7P6R9_METFA|nr:isopentenyl phosphate kinase [Methanocaldococcus fervens]ACV24251.1 aspartate/glutamate/uridylate kinase [Methanocaldococcus fervens AG86]